MNELINDGRLNESLYSTQAHCSIFVHRFDVDTRVHVIILNKPHVR